MVFFAVQNLLRLGYICLFLFLFLFISLALGDTSKRKRYWYKFKKTKSRFINYKADSLHCTEETMQYCKAIIQNE